jgi:hypothetical protein
MKVTEVDVSQGNESAWHNPFKIMQQKQLEFNTFSIAGYV